MWDDILLSAQGTGFQPATVFQDLRENDRPEINLVLNGSPTVLSYNLSKTALSISTAETIQFDVEVSDVFNESGQPYQCTLRLLDSNQATAAIITADLKTQGRENYLFEGKILSEYLAVPGSYTLEVEVQDPDNHRHRLNSGLSLQAQ